MLKQILRLREARRRLRPGAIPITTIQGLQRQIELRRVALRDIGLLRIRLGNLLGKTLRNSDRTMPGLERICHGKTRSLPLRVRSKPGSGQNGRREVV